MLYSTRVQHYVWNKQPQVVCVVIVSVISFICPWIRLLKLTSVRINNDYSDFLNVYFYIKMMCMDNASYIWYSYWWHYSYIHLWEWAVELISHDSCSSFKLKLDWLYFVVYKKSIILMYVVGVDILLSIELIARAPL